MEAWLRKLLDQAGTAFRALAQAVADRFVAFYGWLNRVFGNISRAWGKLLASIGSLRLWLERAVAEVFLTLRWLITIRIPQAIKGARDALVRWASAVIATVRSELKGLIKTLDKWTKSAVAFVSKALADFSRWARGQLSWLYNTLTKTRDLVFLLLTSPAHLASWLVAAMVREIWMYADRNADRIANWARARSVAFTMSQLERIEGIIRRIL